MIKVKQNTILALDLGTTTGFAIREQSGLIISGVASFHNTRFKSGGMVFLRFKQWLRELKNSTARIDAIYFEEVRAHNGVDAAHKYGEGWLI